MFKKKSEFYNNLALKTKVAAEHLASHLEPMLDKVRKDLELRAQAGFHSSILRFKDATEELDFVENSLKKMGFKTSRRFVNELELLTVWWK